MAFSIMCKDALAKCPGEFTTTTEHELLEHFELHAKRAHPDVTMDEGTYEQLKNLVKVVLPVGQS